MTNFFKDSNTKPFAITICILLAVLIACGVWWTFFPKTAAPAKETPAGYYTISAQICEINSATDTVTCESYDGNLWEFYGVSDWKVGERIDLLMHNNSTAKVFDDEIIGVARGKWYLE